MEILILQLVEKALKILFGSLFIFLLSRCLLVILIELIVHVMLLSVMMHIITLYDPFD